MVAASAVPGTPLYCPPRELALRPHHVMRRFSARSRPAHSATHAARELSSRPHPMLLIGPSSSPR